MIGPRAGLLLALLGSLAGCDRCDHPALDTVPIRGVDPPANFHIGSPPIEYRPAAPSAASDPLDPPFPQAARGDCNNGRADGDETDIDCGGDCRGCPTGHHCLLGADCASGLCTAGLCEPPKL